MPDHYDLLGVSRDATKDEIRDAYRAKRDALGAEESETAKRDVGRLNEAWQTLADPTQRGRYDASIDSGEPLDDVEVVDASDATGDPPAPPRRRGMFSPPDGAAKRELAQPTVDLPPGTRFPENRTRINAMLFDFAIVTLIFLGVQMLGVRWIDSRYPIESGKIDAAQEQLDKNQDALDDANSKLDAAEKVVDDAEKDGGRASAAQSDSVKSAQSDVDDLKKQRDDFEDKYKTAYGKLANPRWLVAAFGSLIGFAYLVISGIGSGQTIGMRLRRVRVVQVESGRPTTRGSMIRYGIPALFVAVTVNQLGVLAAVLAVVGVLTWIRNNNHQGWHDRAAHTIVVEDIPPTASTESPRGGTT